MICLPLTPLPAPSWHGWPKERTGARLSPNTRYRLSSHPNEKRPSHYGRGAQSDDKAYNRKNCPDKRKIGCNFCFLQVDLPSPSGSSNPVARLQAQGLASRRWRPFLTIKDRQKRLGDKFCRRQNFLVSCTCILGVDLPSPSGSSNPVARSCLATNFASGKISLLAGFLNALTVC